MKEVFAKTKKGKLIMSKLCNMAKNDIEYLCSTRDSNLGPIQSQSKACPATQRQFTAQTQNPSAARLQAHFNDRPTAPITQPGSRAHPQPGTSSGPGSMIGPETNQRARLLPPPKADQCAGSKPALHRFCVKVRFLVRILLYT